MDKTSFLSRLRTDELIGSKYAQLAEPFRFYSAVLGRIVEVPTGFICDYESVPMFKASSKRAGVGHDYLSRIDSKPVVTKMQAAAVYDELQALRDEIVCEKTQLPWRNFLRFVKTNVVRVWPGYFHRFPVDASLNELMNR